MPFKDPAVRRERHREYQRRYLAQPGKMEAQRERIAARAEEIRQWLREMKAGLSCSRCGENRPQALDFHHRDSSTKEFSLGTAVKRGFSRQRILAEIERCEVLCSNCHRVEHAAW